MRMKTTTKRLDIDHGDSITRPPSSTRRRTHLLFAILFAMGCAILLMDAVLPLRDLWFYEALLTQLGSWPVLPSQILFPGWQLIPPLPHLNYIGVPQVVQSWEKLPLLLDSFIIVFLVYLLALRQLPEHITKRYLLRSTVLLGILYMLIPIVTSPDLYSYIAYARIGVIHGLNPLTTPPTAIRGDVIYSYIFWVDQPSAYGPTWAIITCSLQWLTGLFGGASYLLTMVIVLRVLGLASHLISTLLIWSISGHLQQKYGTISSTTRLRATLAFAWNPLLLFEACVNAHNDTTLLSLILLAIWFLVRNATRIRRGQIYCAPSREGGDKHLKEHTFTNFLNMRREESAPYIPLILATAILAFATCLKINVALLVPGLLLYLWMQEPVRGRFKRVIVATTTYTGTILLLYVPFWQGRAILNVFSVNPATYRSINTVADFLGHFYNGIMGAFGYSIVAPIGSPAERMLHTLSLGIFVI